jgi:fatty-acyl-CoA synthase
MIGNQGGNQGLGSWPRRRARLSPDAVALSQGARELTYAELADRVDRWAGALARLGVRRGDRVAWLGANDIATFEAFFATTLLGAVFVPLNTRLAPVELRYLREDCDPTVLVIGNGVDHLVPEVSEGYSLSRMAELVEAADPLVEEPEVALEHPALILYTSGTTGKPKGAVLTHANLTWNTVNQLVQFDLHESDRGLCIAPLFHAVGLGQITLPTLLKGGRVEVVTKFDAGTILELIHRLRITSFSCVPTMLQLMAEHPSWPDVDLSSLEHVIYGGSSIKASVALEWLDRGVAVLQGYGMTEASPGVYMAVHDGATEHPTSIGVPHFFTDVAHRTDDGKVAEIELGGPGRELLIRGPHVFAGYWNRPDETRDSLVDEQWFRTGDVVRSDPDGWSYVVDRVKDVIISGGENIYPAEVEAVAVTFEGVRSAAVVGTPDERWGEVGVAFVEPFAGARIDEQALRRHFESHLARFKVPRDIEIVGELPRNATGKVLRSALRNNLRPSDTPRETS